MIFLRISCPIINEQWFFNFDRIAEPYIFEYFKICYLSHNNLLRFHLIEDSLSTTVPCVCMFYLSQYSEVEVVKLYC